MSSLEGWPGESFDAYLARQLKAAFTWQRPPAAVRWQLLASVQRRDETYAPTMPRQDLGALLDGQVLRYRLAWSLKIY